MEEVWKDIPNYNNYKISSMGRIIRKETYTKTGKLIPSREFNFTEDKDGYFKTALRNEDGRKYFRVHRLVAITFLDNPYNLPVVNHENGNKKDNRLENLSWCTVSYNTKHTFDVLGRKLDPKIWGIKTTMYDIYGNKIKDFDTYVEVAEYLGCSVQAVLGYFKRKDKFGDKATIGIRTKRKKHYRLIHR